MGNQYNVLIDIVGALLVGAILVAEYRQKRQGDSLNTKLLFLLMLCCTLVFLTDLPGLLLDGKTFSGARPLLWLADSGYWALQAVYCWLWLLFADYWANGSPERLKKYAVVYALPMAAELLLVVTNPFTHWIFTIDGLNVYARGSGYLPNMLLYGFYIVAALGITVNGYIKSTEPEQRRRKLALAVYMFLPVCGVGLDIFVYGISWVWPMVALSLLMVYLNVEQQASAEKQLSAARLEAELSERRLSAARLEAELTEKQLTAARLETELVEKELAAAQMESELTQGRVAIMLSQIQPHFLYNSLNTMDALCDVDTKAAQKAIRSFARYLRWNLDAISRKTPVPFRDELVHLRQYLTLETYRFDTIQVEYDLEAIEFMLPPLTLQPIVENAVKHGVLKRKGGGTITISTREKKGYIQITVEDDGQGFDMAEEKADGRSHIGISNVRSRLETMCGGTLTIESTPGVGTIATFIIPKGGAIR